MKIRGQKVFSHDERLNRLSKPAPSGCIEWTGATRNGYGRLFIGSRTDESRRCVSAHRLAYETHVGPIPAGLFVCHSCDNPKCVNPAHLFAGTRQDNVDDRESKERNKLPPVTLGEKHHMAKFSDKEIALVRAEEGPSCAVAKKYGMSGRYVRNLRRNENRKLPEPPKE